ncbi:FtsX-like permease family protein [Fulvivirga sp. RKSG066]|uniref:ABC transporter permease n=1 Tax=Fulvivirga aurantia TaxID=2529383 RepID=UPI0012BD113F|nr:ABC transporter permease [Fulvivirga aurantia]MTI20188.1 FtsX-like permease family protein [Fulvivirga aurantia]
MLKNYLKITFRSLWKSKVFVLINILGMGTAIGCCIVAFLNYDFNVNFDSNQTSIENIYRIDAERVYQERKQVYGMSPFPLAMAVKENVGEVEDVLRYMPSGGNFKIGDELFNENFLFTDSNLFDFFDFEIIEGDRSALSEKSNILISEKLVEKYFPDGNAVGKTLTHFTSHGPKDYTVAAVFAMQPLNSSFANTQTIARIDNWIDLQNQGDDTDDVASDWTYWSTTFVKINDKTRLKAVEQRLTENYIEIQNQARLDFKLDKYTLEPFEGMPHRAANDEVWSHWLRSSMPPPAVFVPGIMSILILLIACFNFTNTSMAIASKRLKEIGLRKVMGGLRKQLIAQFLMENVVLCFLSLIVGLILAAFMVPAYSGMWPFLEININLTENLNFYIFLLATLLFTGLVAGSYPAFYISKFEPASILKGSLKYGGTNRITSVLLTLQFSISLLAIILGVIFYQNAVFQEEMDYGFDNTGAISLHFENLDDYRAYENVIRDNPAILSIAGSEHQIDRSYRNDPIVNAEKEYDVDILHVGENFFETIDFELLEGRGFRKDSKTDMKESVIVSEELVRVFGWDKPLGQKVVWMDTASFYVVGVMKDAFLDGLWGPIDPLMLRYVPEEDYQFMTVKTNTTDLISTNDYLEEEWKKLHPDRMYTGDFMDDELSQASLVNGNIMKLFAFLGVVATFMSVLGLFSLVSLSILKRMKEIGIRKVLGASLSHLMLILNKNFVIILLIAAGLGSVLSYMLADALMGSIWEYHVTPGALSFILSIALLMVIALSTIGLKVYKAAVSNPTETIRSE